MHPCGLGSLKPEKGGHNDVIESRHENGWRRFVGRRSSTTSRYLVIISSQDDKGQHSLAMLTNDENNKYGAGSNANAANSREGGGGGRRTSDQDRQQQGKSGGRNKDLAAPAQGDPEGAHGEEGIPEGPRGEAQREVTFQRLSFLLPPGKVHEAHIGEVSRVGGQGEGVGGSDTEAPRVRGRVVRRPGAVVGRGPPAAARGRRRGGVEASVSLLRVRRGEQPRR